MLKISLQSNAAVRAASLLTTLAAAAALGLSAGSTDALAQKKDAPKAAAPAAKAPAKEAGAADEQGKSAWVKLCEKAQIPHKDKDGKDTIEEKNICLTHHERLDGNTGMVLVSAALRHVDGQDKDHFMIMVPLGMAIPPGVRAAVYTKEQWEKAAKNEKIDEKALKPVELKYSLCHPAGCTAETEATKELLDGMMSGGGIMVLALNASAQPIAFPVPLDGFAEAQKGAPVDNKKYAEARGQLMQQIRERQKMMIEQMRQEQAEKAAKGGDAAAAPKAAAPAEKKK